MKRFLLIGLLAVFGNIGSGTIAAELPENYWINVGRGFVGGESAGISISDNKRGWNFAVSRHGNPYSDKIIESYEISRTYQKPFRSGFAEFGVGIAYMHGICGASCIDKYEGKEVSTFAIPLIASATFGRYVGISWSVRLLKTSDSGIQTAIVGLSFPIGNFPNR